MGSRLPLSANAPRIRHPRYNSARVGDCEDVAALFVAAAVVRFEKKIQRCRGAGARL